MAEIKKMPNYGASGQNILDDFLYKCNTFNQLTEYLLTKAKPVDFLAREKQGLKNKLESLEKKLYNSKLSDEEKTKLSEDIANIDAVLRRKKSASRNAIQVETIDILNKLTSQNGINFLCASNGKIYCYLTTHWNEIDSKEFRKFIKKFVIKLGASKYVAKHYKFLDEIENQFFSDSSRDFKNKENQDAILINFQNGTYNFKTKKLESHTPVDNLTYVLNFDFNPDSKSPLFDKFLNEVLADKQKQNVVAEFIASVFIKKDVLKLEKLLLLYGTGSNGKSVVFEIVQKLLGAENITNYSLESLSDKNGYTRAEIENKLLNYSSEISSRTNPDFLKQMASGEPIPARVIYRKPFVVNNYAKLMFNANVLPKDTEDTDGFFRRFLIIHFDKVIPQDKQDNELAKKIIESELSGVFNWVMQGFERLIKNKSFSPCESSDKIVAQYRTHSDSVAMYLNEANARKSLNGIKIKELYDRYRGFCIASGYKTNNRSKFEESLQNKGYTIDKVYKVKNAFIEVDEIDV